jgi:hypothetical protein
VSCPISIGGTFSSLVSALFVPCASAGPKIQYEYSSGASSVRNSQSYPATTSSQSTYDQWLNIPGTSGTYLGYGYYLTAGFSGAFSSKRIAASLSIDVCGTATSGTGQISGCASQYPTQFKTEMGATSACPDHPCT